MLYLRQASVFFCTALLVACQTDGSPNLSLEEAKQVTASFDGQSFVPPPRSIADVVALLDELASLKSDTVEKRRIQASASPPPSASKKELALFYEGRGNAARLLGRFGQGIEDAERAYRLSPDKTYDFHMTLAGIHDELGNNKLAAEHAAKGESAAKSPGRIMSSNSVLTAMLAIVGDLDGAAAALSRSKSFVLESHRWESEWAPFLRGMVGLAEGILGYHQGEYAKAEQNLRAAAQVFDDATPDIPEVVTTTPSGKWASFGVIGLVLKTQTLRVLGQVLMRQGRLAEAEAIAREALAEQVRHFGFNSGQTVEGLSALIETLSEQERFEETAKLAKVTLGIYAKMGADRNSVTLSVARRTLADAYVGQSRWREATAAYDRIEEDLASNPDGLRSLRQSNLTWALALIQSGRGGEAVSRLRAVHANLSSELGPEEYGTAEAQGLLGCALALNGEEDAALKSFSQALPNLLSRSKRSDTDDSTESGRRLRLRYLLECYLRALSDRAAKGRKGPNGISAEAEAFRVANAARGGTVKRALGYSAARAAAKDPDLADLARHEQNALQRIGALNGRLSRTSGAAAEGGTRQALLERIALLRASREAIMADLSARFPSYSSLIDPKPATVRQARESLAPGESLISTYVSENRTYVWSAPFEGEVAFAAVNLGREELADVVDILRTALDPNAATLGDIPEFDLDVAHGLYKKLLTPVEAGMKNARNLLVVAHGSLGYLPLSLLPTKPASLEIQTEPLFGGYREAPWLARDHAVTMLPSVASLRTLRGLPPGGSACKSFVGFGDPWFNGDQASEAKQEASKAAKVAALVSRGLKTRGRPVRLRAVQKGGETDNATLAILPRLPDTAKEVLSMAKALNADLEKDVFLGARASEGSVKGTNLSGYRVVSFATHGLVPGDLNVDTSSAEGFTGRGFAMRAVLNAIRRRSEVLIRDSPYSQARHLAG